MGTEFSHLNIANVNETIDCDKVKLLNLYMNEMNQRGKFDAAVEEEVSKMGDEFELDNPFTSPQNMIARRDFMINLNEFDTIFKEFHQTGKYLT